MYTDPKPWDENEDGVGVQTDPEDGAVRNQQWHPQNWEAIMEEAEGLAYDDPWSDSDTTVMELDGSKGPALSLHDEAANSLSHTARHAAPHMPGSPMDHMLPLEVAITSKDAIEVHVDEAELNNL